MADAFPLRLGFGAASYWCKASFPETHAARLVHLALERGIRLFDTGYSYGNGLAEERLGRALKGRSEPCFIATKAGSRSSHAGRAVQDFSPAWIRQSAEESLRRLQRERIDLLQLHNPSIAEIDGAADMLAQLKAEGKVARIGVSSFEPAVQQHLIRSGRFDAMMMDFNLLKRPHAACFRDAHAAGMTTLAAMPLANGALSPALLRPSTRNAWYLLRAIKNYRLQLLTLPRYAYLTQVEGWSAAQLALAFVLAEPSVSAALVNTTRESHLAELIDAATRTLPTDLHQRMAA